jgi:flagellar basal-body rod protein FlgG
MNGAFYIGATGLEAQERALNVVANNITNLNTTAYKRSAVQFSNLVMPSRDKLDQPITGLDRSGEMAGVVAMPAPRIWTQGDLKQTGAPFDLAIDGAGFVELMGPSGHTLLWRGGAFKVNADGYLATADGTPFRAMISVPRDATGLTIGRDGVVSASSTGSDGKSQVGQIGQIELVMAKDPSQLAEVGSGYYEAADAADVFSTTAGEDGGGVFTQGAIEGSNVDLSNEMVTMLLMQRSFSANAQVVQAGDQLMSIVNNLRRQ